MSNYKAALMSPFGDRTKNVSMSKHSVMSQRGVVIASPIFSSLNRDTCTVFSLISI